MLCYNQLYLTATNYFCTAVNTGDASRPCWYRVCLQQWHSHIKMTFILYATLITPYSSLMNTYSAMASSVNPWSHHSLSHVFHDLWHLATFMQPSSHQSMPSMSPWSMVLKPTPAWTIQPPMQNDNWDPVLLQASWDAGLLDNQHPWADDSLAQFHHWDPNTAWK